VFLLNSRLGLFSAPAFAAGPLLPKLRGQFAEFLNEGSLVRLRGLAPRPPVSVCGTVTVRLPSGFSGPVLPGPRAWVSPPARDQVEAGASPLPRGSSVAPRPARSGVPGRSTPPVVSDYQPILHRLRLDASGLGPTNPPRMFLPAETSGLRRTRFSRALSLLIPAFALRLAPGALPGPPSPPPNAPLPRPPRGGHPRLRWVA
jgi:hypothetical protein